MKKVFRNTSGVRARIVAAALTTLGVPAMADVTDPFTAPTFQMIVEFTSTAGAARTWQGTVPAANFALNQTTGAWDLVTDWTPTIGNAEGLISFTLKADGTDGNVDPFLSYSFNASNNTANPVTFQKVVSAPVMPGISGANQVRASIGYVLTDAGNNGVTLSPAPAGSIGQDGNNGNETQIFRLSNSASTTVPGANNATWVNAGVDVGLGATHTGFGAGVFSYQDGFIAGPVAGALPTSSWNWMQTRTRFSLTGGGDAVGISGYAEIVPVPEPGEWAMMLAGLGVVGAVAARRRRASAS